MLTLGSLGETAEEFIYRTTGGAAADAEAASGQMVNTGPVSAPTTGFVPGYTPSATNTPRTTTMPWMNLITGALNQGNAASQTFAAGSNAYQRQSNLGPYLLAGGALVGVGFLAWLATRR